jgi:predicted CopG family antitoxin
MRKRTLTRQVGVMFSEETYQQLIKVTNEKEISLSQFIRDLVEEGLKKILRNRDSSNN